MNKQQYVKYKKYCIRLQDNTQELHNLFLARHIFSYSEKNKNFTSVAETFIFTYI